MKRKQQWRDVRLVYCPVYLAICTSEAEYVKAAKRLGCAEPGSWINPGADATCNTFSTSIGKPACIVCIRPRGKRTRAEWAALIVHEATHVWQKIRQELGESRPSSEFEAYSLQAITQELFEAVGL